ncbi:MAG: HEAT repeat domain-containing protein [Planctomycetota bacterium]
MRGFVRLGLAAALLAVPARAADKAKVVDRVCRKPAVTDFKVTCDRWPDGTDLRQFGLDAIRIEGAATNEQKALAVWRWMRRCTMRTNGQSPREGRRWVDASKILNVYGAHHCGGLSLLLTDIWRSIGYPARRLYRHGHTLGDLWYEDTDGVGRYHTFDNNYGWFVYTRDGSRIAHAEEIGADFSLYDHLSRTHVPWIDKKCWCWGWCHMPQMALPRPRTMNLHPGESVTRLWGNIGVPHHDNVGVRPWDENDQPPYKRAFGNGISACVIEFGPGWKDSLAAEPVNATVRDGALVQADPAKPAEVIYRVWLPYIVADGSVTLKATGAVTVETDRGQDWRTVRSGVDYTEQGLTKKNGGPPGRYSYLLRVRLAGGGTVHGLVVRNVVQLNSRSLPTLLAGENKITVHGKLAEGYAVRVKYVWDDVDGKERAHEAVATSLPFSYTIRTAGEDWDDVTCRRITTAVVPDDGKGSRVVRDVPAPSVVPDGPLPSADVRTIIGPEKPPELKSTDAYVKDLASEDLDVRRRAAASLIVKRDPKAWDALRKLATEDVTQAKLHAIQALFWTDRKRAAPFLRKVLTRDESIRFAKKDTKFGTGTNENCVGTIAAMCGLAGFTELVPELNERAWKSSTNGRWAVVRALGRLNDPRGYPAIRRFCKSGNLDTTTIACKAAGRVKDPEAIRNAARWLRSRRYPIRTLNAIEAIGRAGVTGHTDIVLEQLERRRSSEDWRARCASALARVGEPGKCIGPLETLLEEEKWPWVRERLRAALAALRERAKTQEPN